MLTYSQTYRLTNLQTYRLTDSQIYILTYLHTYMLTTYLLGHEGAGHRRPRPHPDRAGVRGAPAAGRRQLRQRRRSVAIPHTMHALSHVFALVS